MVVGEGRGRVVTALALGGGWPHAGVIGQSEEETVSTSTAAVDFEFPRTPASEIAIVRPEAETLSKQRLPYFVGVSGASAGATRISMNLVVIPPAGEAEPHSHRGYETAVYMMKGRVDVRYGQELEQLLTLEEGDFLFIPADLPHQPVNLDPTEPALAIVARNDANEQESVEIFHHHSHGTDENVVAFKR
jgi:uncharacterized RmlC-like cupin family protein